MINGKRYGSVGRKLLYIVLVYIKTKQEREITTYTFPTQQSEILRCTHSAFPTTSPRLDGIGFARCGSVCYGRHDDGDESCYCSCCHECYIHPLDNLTLFFPSAPPSQDQDRKQHTLSPLLPPATTNPIDVTSTAITIQEVTMLAMRP
jgi:hypothetical protein